MRRFIAMAKLHNLRFNVAQLLNEPIGATRSYDLVASVDHLAPELGQADLLELRVHMLRTNRGVLVEGTAQGALVGQCSRCLRDVTVPVQAQIQEEFVPTVDVVRGTWLLIDEEDESLHIDEQHILDLSEVLRQALLLEIPMQLLCRPDCAGLCPSCGQDLNLGHCNCTSSDFDPRWQALSALLSDADTP